MTVHSPVAVFLSVLLILSTVAAMLGLMLAACSFVDGCAPWQLVSHLIIPRRALSSGSKPLSLLDRYQVAVY